MGLKLKAEWKNSSKRLLAAGLSLAMIGGMLDLSASVAAAQTTEPQAAVAASEPLTEGIQEQQSAVAVYDSTNGSSTASGGAIAEHTHHWTYMASGYTNFIGATCDSTCPYKSVQITIQGVNTIYTGQEMECRVEVSVIEGGKVVYKTPQELGITLPDIVYVKGDMGPTDISIAGKPVDAGEYWGLLTIEGAKARAQILINQITPVVKQQPMPTAITYGETLGDSELRNGAMKVSGEDDTEVAGTFTWKEPDVRPTVADSNATEYEIVFTPADQKKYVSVELKSTLNVQKAANAPHMPDTVKGVSRSVTKVGDAKLPADWVWAAADQDKELEIGVPQAATAEYTGADKGNYVKEQVEVWITRSECEHVAGDILYTGTGEHAPTCTVDGIGHTECTKCGDLVDSDVVVKAAHKFSAEWTVDVEATTTTEGSKSHHCTVCDEKTDITVIPKLSAPSGGGSSSGGGAVTPVQPEQPSDTKEDVIPDEDDSSAEQPEVTPVKLEMSAGRTTKTTQKLTWEKVEGADGYEIYAAPRNTKNKTYRLKLQRTVKGTRTGYTVKGLKGGTAYRYVIKAYRIVDGEKVYIARSAIRATAKGNK